jgi:thiamine biosynthesis protein ThiI
MKKLILIKYGELTTKKDNRNFFIKTLKRNIYEKLSSFSFDIKEDYYRMFIYPKDENDLDKMLSSLKNIFGIHALAIVKMIEDNDIDSIKELALDEIKDKDIKSFKVETKRSDKSYPIKSIDFNRLVATKILKEYSDLKVDIHNPDILIEIEIRNKSAYLYLDKYEGLKGYPVKTLGKGLLMLSGGIDSPVAGYLAIKKGIKLNYIYFESLPHTSLEARNKVIELAKILEKYNDHGKLYVVNFTKIQEAIYKNLKPDYLITIMRRMMYRIAVTIAKKYKYLAVINGESVGQVASQTLTSIKAVNDVTNYPIIRPLACFDKEEIIKISKSIGAYETSILPYEDCCTVFVPKHPVINPNLNIIYDEEDKYDFEPLLEEAINNINVINLNEDKEEYNEYL